MKKIKKKRQISSANLPASLTVQAAKIGPTVLLESSFILALLDPRDPNYKAVKSIFGFLEPHNCRFHIPLYVFSEVFSKILQKEKKVSCALKVLDKFQSELHGVLFTGTNPTLEEIFSRYKVLARKKIRFLQSNDFYIAAEGIISNSYILTCDLEMYEKVKRNYPDIYYVAVHSKKYKDDIPRFTKRILGSVR
jgi:predicted nucleic acid-binding protein